MLRYKNLVSEVQNVIVFTFNEFYRLLVIFIDKVPLTLNPLTGLIDTNNPNAQEEKRVSSVSIQQRAFNNMLSLF